MTTGAPITEMLRTIRSADWVVVRDGVELVGDWLRTAIRSPPEQQALGDVVLELASHPKWEVRRAVAQALEFLGHGGVHSSLARLTADENPWVRAAAERTTGSRKESARADAVHRDLLHRWRTELAGKYGPKASAAAMRLAERYADLLVREASHEIVKVIAPIEVALTNLENNVRAKRVNRAACERHIALGQKRLRHLTGVVSALRDYADVSAPNFRREQLRTLTEEAIAQVSSHLPPGTLAATLDVDESIHVDVDGLRLLQAFSNLIQNAVESYDEGPSRIRIEAVQNGRDRIVLRFQDEGRGMSEEALRDAVQLYSTRKTDGIGFGLPLAKKIIEIEHGGTLTLESDPGRGTTVNIELPLEQVERLG